jgi:predicted dehydrogenase
MATPFRIAFLGLDHPHGAGWRKALTNLGDAAAITAIVPRFAGATASLEERHSDAARFETIEALLARGEFDGAIVCLPNNEGPAAVAALAAAGKHVLVEKPGAASTADFQAAAAAIRKAGVAFQSGYMWRYDPLANRLKEMVADGRFGKLISIEMLYVTSNVARRGPEHYLFDRATSGGGFFNWLACHWLDLLLYITGQSVVAVTARIGTFGATPTDVEDGGTAILELDGGGIATFTGGYWLPRWAGETRLTFRGRDRWVHWDTSRAGTGGVLDIHGPQPQFDAMNETFIQPEDKTPGYGGARAVATLTDWIESARQGGQSCRNTPESMLATLSLIDTIYESSRAGRRVECRVG